MSEYWNCPRTLSLKMHSLTNKFSQNKINNNGSEGRRKFGVSSKITNELRRAIRTSNLWVHNTPSDLLKLFEYDFQRNYLPIRGNRVIKFDYNLLDVLSLLKTFEATRKDTSTGRKLKDQPLLSGAHSECIKQNTFADPEGFKWESSKTNHSKQLEEYFMNNDIIYDVDNIDSIYAPFSMGRSFMRCVYETLKILETSSTSNLNEKLFKRLTHIELKRLDAYGVYMFILHLKVRGIAEPSSYRDLLCWRFSWKCRTTEERQHLLNQWYLGPPTTQTVAMQHMYIKEQEYKLALLSSEARIIRYPSGHSPSYFSPASIRSATWKLGIYDQMTPVERFRDHSGLVLTPHFVGEPTMFTVKKALKEASSEVIQDAIPEIKEALNETLKSPEVKAAVSDFLTEALEPTIQNLETKATSVSDNTLEKVKKTIQPIIDQSFSFFSSLNGLVDFFKSMLNQAIGAFPKEMFGMENGLKLDTETLFQVLKYYILYINIESRPLKMIIIYLVLRDLGLLPWIHKWGHQIFQYAFGHTEVIPEPQPSTSTFKGEPTSGMDWMNSLIEMIIGHKNEIGLCTVFTTLLVMIFKHVTAAKCAGNLRFNEYSTIAGTVMGVCKGFHWIGNGFMGIDKVYKYFMIISKSLTKYIREHIIGISDEAMTNEKAVAKWLVQLKYFSTDSGRNAIRVSDSLLARAERLEADGLAFIASASKDPNFISRDTLMQIHRSWKDVQTLANYTYRIRSTSNFKPAMFHVQFVGEPGIGKSTLTESFINKLSNKIYPEDKKISHWTYNPNVDHFDGYNGQTYMIIDDLFRYNEPKHLSLVIGLITNTPVPLPMAHLEDKGVHLDSDILISSTNVPYPIGKDIFCMEAVHRRRHILCEVTMDPRVRKDGKFSGELFQKYYPGQDSHKFPHLKFSLMKPVVMPGEDQYQTTDRTEATWKHDLVKKLQKANDALKFEPEFYFGENARPLEGMTVPCTGWNFDTFIENTAVAYKHLRAGEQKLSKKEKYEHVMECFAELDNIFVQSDDLAQGYAASTTFKLISDKFLDASYQYGMDDPLGKKIYISNKSEIAPDVYDIDIENMVSNILNEEEGTPTNGSDSDSEYEDTGVFEHDYFTGNSHVASVDPTKTIADKFRMDCEDYLRINDPSGQMRDTLVSMIHTNLKGLDWNNIQWRVYNYITDNGPHPFEEEVKYQDTIPSADGEEGSRRMRIMQKLRKKIPDPLVANQMKVRIVPVDNQHIPAIAIRSSYTAWEGTIDSSTFPGDKFQNYVLSDETMEKVMKEYEGFAPHDKLLSFFKLINSGAKFSYPARQPYDLEQQKQGNSHISIEFLRRLSYAYGEWYMDVSDLDYPICHSLAIKASVNNVQRIYHVPIDVAFFCSINRAFTYTANLFSLLSTAQQQDMVKTAKWLHTHLYDCSFENISQRLRVITNQVKQKAMAHVFQTVKWVWTQLKTVVKMVAKVAVFAALIYLLKSIGSLFQGKSEPSSKFLHRAQIQTGLRYRGQPQNQFLDKGNTQQILAQQYLDKNVKFFTIIPESGKVSVAHGVHTKQFLIINAHTADEIQGQTILRYKPTINCDTEWEIEISPLNVYKSKGNDLAIIFSRHLPMAKDILSHFITNEDFETTESVGELWSLTNFQHQQSIEIRDRCQPHKKVTMSCEDGRRGEMSMAILVDGVTVGGKSGSMLISPSKRPGHRSIVGIQAWKITDFYKQTIVYQVVTQELLNDLIDRVQQQVNRPIIDQEGPLICEPTMGKAAGLVTSHIQLEGSVPADKVVGMVGRTQFVKTAIAHSMDRDGFTSNRVPAALNFNDQRLLVPIHPMRHSINKHGTGKVGTFDLIILDRASQDIAYWLRDRLDKDTFRTDLSLEECVTGIREPGSNPVDCRKSAGLPYVWDKWHGKPKGKKAYVNINEEGMCEIESKEFADKFEQTFAKLQKGIIPKHTSYDFPKDELRPYFKALGDPDKLTPPKTRSVTCMNMEIIFSWRRVTLDLFSAFHRRARGDFPFGPGINPEGPDWTRLFHFLNKHPNCLDFDVSNWDGHMPPELMFAAADTIVTILGVHYDSKEAKVIYAILTEVLFGHVQFEDIVYQKQRGLISGFPGTAEVNTLVHLILMYYFYLFTAEVTDNIQYANVHDFFYFTSPLFYGDDVIISVSDEIIEWFNGRTIAEMYKQHGYPVTTASKTDDMPKTKTIWECTFLKSGFNYISPARVDRLMDKSVCFDLMYWVRAKEHPYDQFRSNLFDAFRLLHGHGKVEFEETRKLVNSWLRKNSLEPFDYRWEDFEKDKIQKYYSE